MSGRVELSLEDLQRCFEGVIPAVIATAAADGTPNVTYLSKIRVVDERHVALSNQFFSKTSRNLTENPRASVLAIDPADYEEYRLDLVYERHERRGPVFDQLARDVDEVAALSGMQDVFKLRGADIYRVDAIEHITRSGRRLPGPLEPDPAATAGGPAGLAELCARLGRCPDLDTLVGVTVDGLDELLGHEHSLLCLADESGERLFTIASHGYPVQGVGSEVVVGEGTIGMAAARRAPARIGNLRQMSKYSQTVRRAYEGIGPGHEVPVPELPEVQSRLAVPALSLGRLVGVLVVESTRSAAFNQDDEAALTVVAALLAGAIEVERNQEAEPAVARGPVGPIVASGPVHHLRYFAVDGSTFLDGEYLIKGVAGRILWALLGHHQREGRVEFTNKEVRLDPSLELPEFRDNLESRLILLKRRLDERAAPVRIEKTGRGRFRLVVAGTLRLEEGPG